VLFLYGLKMTPENHPPADSGSPAGKKPFVLAHLSDPHISNMGAVRIRDLFSKRLYGFLRWQLHRGTEHHGAVLSALLDDLKHHRPDHVALTGDLTHLSLPAEFQNARKWFQSIGPPQQVTVIPGNHDAYVPTQWRHTHAHWTDYMLSDDAPAPTGPSTGVYSVFPSWRVRGPIALIGICTAHPSAPYLAVGSIGEDQMQRLEKILDQATRRNLFRVILIHHPPAAGTVSWRKRLTDAAEFQALVQQYGADLILHGHAHRAARNQLPVPGGNVQVVGAPSASAIGRSHQRMARYYIYRIAPGSAGWNVDLTVRIYAPEQKVFITESQEQFRTSNKSII
jgi:3',5'-cyclic AMP phosphodiesterase CpdA